MHSPNVPMVLPRIAARLFTFSLGFALFYRCLCIRQLVIAKYYDVIFVFLHRTGNCSIQRIPLASPDVASEQSSASHVRIKHAKQLLDIDPKEFVYSGEVGQYCYEF